MPPRRSAPNVGRGGKARCSGEKKKIWSVLRLIFSAALDFYFDEREMFLFPNGGYVGQRKHHGLKSKHPAEYRTWLMMRNRCNNPRADDYRHYGGRGIKICARWDSFPVFLSDMGCRPTPAHCIERIRVNKNYGPNNCKWETRQTQSRNRRYCKLSEVAAKELRQIKAEGKFCIKIAQEKYKCGKTTIYDVLRGRRWV